MNVQTEVLFYDFYLRCHKLIIIIQIVLYSVMQSDVNSFKIDTFREAISSELMISS